MQRKAFNKECERIMRYIDRYSYLLTLAGWNVDFHFHQRPVKGCNENDAAGYVNFMWEYLAADIHFNAFLTAELDDEVVEETVLHELVHVLVGEATNKRGSIERVVTTISRQMQHLAHIDYNNPPKFQWEKAA